MNDFKKYVEQTRKEFVKEVSKYSVDENLQLRTKADSLLIAFDQLTEQAMNYARSCEELKDKEVMTFYEYLISKGYKLSNTYVWQIDNRDLSNEDIIKQRKQYEYSL